ncbi:alpha-glucosidase, partial [Rhizobium ruizarguesonis]
KPWLPVPVEHILRAVSVQLGDEASVLEHYSRFIAFRKLHPAFAQGGFSTVKPWLPVPVEHILRAVSVQLGDEASVL